MHLEEVRTMIRATLVAHNEEVPYRRSFRRYVFFRQVGRQNPRRGSAV